MYTVVGIHLEKGANVKVAVFQLAAATYYQDYQINDLQMTIMFK